MVSSPAIDLRSDTVTKPTPAMRQAMCAAEVGDDVFGEDPTVNRLQEKVAALLDKPAALFVASGTMGNQLCIKTLTSPGDEVLCEQGAHFLHYEGGALGMVSGAQPRPLPGARGILTAEQIDDAVRPSAYYYPRTRLIALENTHNLAGGVIYPLAEIRRIYEAAQRHKLNMHLDGARLWNACIASGIAPAEYCRCFDSVSVCLSKGLGAPVGSVIAGSVEFVAQARRFRKMLGGGMRQAGILAAAGIYALDHHLQRLADDHANARFLAEELQKIHGVSIDLDTVQTNIVIMDIRETGVTPAAAVDKLANAGILVAPFGKTTLRAVTHLDVDRPAIATALDAFRKVFSS
jgi:threonine aldolase